jgi:hypothetical protein
MRDTVSHSDLDGRIDYARLKAFAQTVGRSLGSLIALSDDNDPFLADRPGRRKNGAQWFAELWNRLDVPDGVHLRRLHYLLVSTAGIRLPDGAPYENTHKCWKDLGRASQDARYLDLVPAGAFVDRRAAEPVVYTPSDVASDASVLIQSSRPALAEASDCALIQYGAPNYEFPDLPSAYLCEPKVADPYSIEVWVEKSSMNDILLPIAQNRAVTLVTGVGELSVTHCHALVRRAREHGGRTRILYISDFDPAGTGMPISVARKVEFFLRHGGLRHLDIWLDPLVLTAEQVTEYRLPRIPIKDSDKRRAQFEARHGEGAVELDALEALHPGALREIVEAAIDRFRKPVTDLRRRIASKARKVRDEIKNAEAGVIDRHTEAIEELREAWEETESEITEHQDAIAAAIERCEQVIAGHEQAITEMSEAWQARAEPIWQQIASEIEQEVPAVEQIEWPALADEELADPLFDSTRDYVAQVERYKRHQDRGNDGSAP